MKREKYSLCRWSYFSRYKCVDRKKKHERGCVCETVDHFLKVTFIRYMDMIEILAELKRVIIRASARIIYEKSTVNIGFTH